MTPENAITRIQIALRDHIAAHGSTAKPKKMYLPEAVWDSIGARFATHENKHEEDVLYGVVVEKTTDALLEWHFEDSAGNRFLMPE